MSYQTTTILLSLCLILISKAQSSNINHGRCEQIAIPFCKHLGYNQTIFPNNLDHETQQEAMDDAYEFPSLVESGCSKDLVYFLCSLYAPVCTMLDSALPPCRSLCTSARKGCESLMNRFGFQWPKRFSCHHFPKSGEKLCVGRNADNSGEKIRKKISRQSETKSSFGKDHDKTCPTTGGRARLCCKLGRKAAKKGFNCNLRRKENAETRKTIKFRKMVVRRCAKYSSCFHSCCETRQRKREAKSLE